MFVVELENEKVVILFGLSMLEIRVSDILWEGLFLYKRFEWLFFVIKEMLIKFFFVFIFFLWLIDFCCLCVRLEEILIYKFDEEFSK